MPPVNTQTPTLLDELAALTHADRNDLAIKLVEINALHDGGEITDEEYAERRAGLYAR
jgi:hypothetical protein